MPTRRFVATVHLLGQFRAATGRQQQPSDRTPCSLGKAAVARALRGEQSAPRAGRLEEKPSEFEGQILSNFGVQVKFRGKPWKTRLWTPTWTFWRNKFSFRGQFGGKLQLWMDSWWARYCGFLDVFPTVTHFCTQKLDWSLSYGDCRHANSGSICSWKKGSSFFLLSGLVLTWMFADKFQMMKWCGHTLTSQDL